MTSVPLTYSGRRADPSTPEGREAIARARVEERAIRRLRNKLGWAPGLDHIALHRALNDGLSYGCEATLRRLRELAEAGVAEEREGLWYPTTSPGGRHASAGETPAPDSVDQPRPTPEQADRPAESLAASDVSPPPAPQEASSPVVPDGESAVRDGGVPPECVPPLVVPPLRDALESEPARRVGRPPRYNHAVTLRAIRDVGENGVILRDVVPGRPQREAFLKRYRKYLERADNGPITSASARWRLRDGVQIPGSNRSAPRTAPPHRDPELDAMLAELRSYLVATTRLAAAITTYLERSSP